MIEFVILYLGVGVIVNAIVLALLYLGGYGNIRWGWVVVSLVLWPYTVYEVVKAMFF